MWFKISNQKNNNLYYKLKNYWVKLFLSALDLSSTVIVIGFWMADPPNNQKAGLEIWFDFFLRKEWFKKKEVAFYTLHTSIIELCD